LSGSSNFFGPSYFETALVKGHSINKYVDKKRGEGGSVDFHNWSQNKVQIVPSTLDCCLEKYGLLLTLKNVTVLG
jgi:hypothetical protein